MFWRIKNFHKVYAGSNQIALVFSLALPALSAPLAHSQTVFIENGGGNLSGYDPASGISVLTGQSNVISAGMQSAQNAQNAYRAATSEENNAAPAATPPAAPPTPIGESVAAKEYGFGLLGGQKTKDVISGASASDTQDQSGAPSASAQNGAGEPAGNPAIAADDDAARMRKNAEQMLKNAQQASGSPDQLSSAISPNKPIEQGQRDAPVFQTVKGKAIALDAITLKVGGTIAILDGLQAPGNQAMCYSGTFPWPCGEKGREELGRLVDDGVVTCRVRSADNKAACITEDGDDLAQMVGRRGFAVSTNALTAQAVNVARRDSRGIFR